MADRSGQQLDNYRLIRLLGAGTYGEVYLAEHIYHKTQVAIKVLPRLAPDDLRGFLTEARTIRLKHPNIVQVLDFGVEERIPFIVMEYASNGTLRQLHPKGTQVPLPIIISYVKQVASALQYAHDERMIHRDVKPENMLLGAQNQVLLSDFGIATIAHGTGSQSVVMMRGTIPYMAPEQIQGHSRLASDQYSLGIVVYEWLCGDRPFRGTPTEIAIQHTIVAPPSLRERVLTLPPDIEQVVMTALAKDPKQRFGNVQAFATALEQAFHSSAPLPAARSSEVLPPQEPGQPSSAIDTFSTNQITRPVDVTTPPAPATLSPLPAQVLPLTGPPQPPPDLAAIPTNERMQSTETPTPPPPTPPSSLSTKESTPSSRSQLPQYSLAQRIALVGAAVLLILGVGLTWLAYFHLSPSTKVTHAPTNGRGNTPPSPTSVIQTYSISLNASQGVPGLETGIQLTSGSRLTVKASGEAIDGPGTDPSHCYGNPINPDGVSIVNGSPCRHRIASSIYPFAPVGALLASIGQVGTTSSTGWFVVGSSFSSRVIVSGELYLIYNDAPRGYFDNMGSYQVTITVEKG